MRTWKAVALGAVVMATAPVTVPVVFAMARPFVKAITKQALVGYERARVRLMISAEELEDLIAEARAEAEEEIASWRRARAVGAVPSQPLAGQVVNGPTAQKPS